MAAARVQLTTLTEGVQHSDFGGIRRHSEAFGDMVLLITRLFGGLVGLVRRRDALTTPLLLKPLQHSRHSRLATMSAGRVS